MVLTSSFTVLIMIMICRTHILLVISYVVVIGLLELIYLSSVLYKFDQGGYLPLAFSAVLMMIMFVWNDVYRKKYNYELVNKISSEKVNDIISNDMHVSRVPGLAVFYSEIVQGIPPIFKHYVENVPALHSVLVFVSIKSLQRFGQRSAFCFAEFRLGSSTCTAALQGMDTQMCETMNSHLR